MILLFARAHGFHKTIMTSIRKGVGSVAPITGKSAAGRYQPAMGMHAADDHAPAAIMDVVQGWRKRPTVRSSLTTRAPDVVAKSLAAFPRGPLGSPQKGLAGALVFGRSKDGPVLRNLIADRRQNEKLSLGFATKSGAAQVLLNAWSGGSRSAPFGLGSTRHTELPSFAPRGQMKLGNGLISYRDTQVGEERPAHGKETPFGRPNIGPMKVARGAGPQTDLAPRQADGLLMRDRLQQAELRRAVGELLDRQARLPPSGATGFDPRLTPAWAGLKLPG